MRKRTRVRRTPEQAREEILGAARARLSAHGMDGLKIADVARDVDMSHATLLHHFGSSEEMRGALVTRMGNELLAELLDMLDGSPLAPEQRNAWLSRVFATLADPRHGQLFAWLALQPSRNGRSAVEGIDRTRELFAALLARMQLAMPAAQAQFIVVLVVTSAIGMGVSRDWLAEIGLGIADDALPQFASRLGGILPNPVAP